MPSWARAAANSGFFSEEASAVDRVDVRSIDVSWRQVQPEHGDLDRCAEGDAQGMHFDGLDAQLAQPGDFWMRLFATGRIGHRCW